ncbi:MAG: fasciclin domain-containing protein [Salinivenus sp.]
MTFDTELLPNSPIRRGLHLCLGLLAAALILVGCDSNGGTEVPNVSEDNSVAEVVAASQNTGTLESALQQAGLVEALDDSSQSFTVFAPTDAAFGTIDAGELTSDGDLLEEVLTYHVVPQAINAGDIQDGQTVTTLEGDTLRFSVNDGTVRVNGATVTNPDIEATNGVVHKIDGVLLETVDVVDRAVLTPQLSTLAAAVDAAGLAGSDSPLRNSTLTLFAPTNGAFEGVNVDALTGNSEILSRTLNYHVIAGQRIGSGALPSGESPATLEGGTIDIDLSGDVPTLNGIPVSTTDIRTENGVVHLIDGVLLQRLDIVQRATVTSALSTLASAVGASSALSASDSPLRNDSPTTVFAPVNGAFQDVDVDELVGNTDLLNEVLTYHAVSGAVTSDQLQSGSVPTLEGGSVAVNVTDTSVTVDDVPVNTTDIRTRNGVVHLVDDVLLRGVDAVDRTVLTSALSTTQAAIEAAGLDGANSPLRGEGPLTLFAPLNSGFDGLEVDELAGQMDLAGRILQYHAISGQRIEAADLSNGETPQTLEGGTITVAGVGEDGVPVTLNGVPVSVTDIQTENAVIHLIDGVLLQRINAVERASITANFRILTELVGEAGLASALSGPGPDGEDGITVFAPTNDALLAALDANGNGEVGVGEVPSDSELRSLLEYHVLDDVFFASDVPTMETPLPTLEGSDVTVVRDGNAVTLNPNAEASSVVAPNVEVSNGVIHGVDTVLQIPSSN